MWLESRKTAPNGHILYKYKRGRVIVKAGGKVKYDTSFLAGSISAPNVIDPSLWIGASLSRYPWGQSSDSQNLNTKT